MKLLPITRIYVSTYHIHSYIRSSMPLNPWYEVYRGYIFFAFSVIMFVHSLVCLSVCKLYFVKDFSATTWVRNLKFGTKLHSDELYCVTKKPHVAYQYVFCSFFFLFNGNFCPI